MPRRRTLVPLLVTGAALAAPAVAPAAPRPLRVKLTDCHHGAAAVDRYLQTTSTVRLVPGSARVVLRYELLWRQAGAADFTRYPSRPFERRFRRASEHVYTVGNLPARAGYRLRVRARWVTRSGRTVRSARRVTPTCFEPDVRADLRIARFVRIGPRRFAAVVRNAGGMAAGPFYVGDRDGDAQGDLLVDGLAPGRMIPVPLAACQAVMADSTGAVDESDEANNAALSPCPRG